MHLCQVARGISLLAGGACQKVARFKRQLCNERGLCATHLPASDTILNAQVQLCRYMYGKFHGVSSKTKIPCLSTVHNNLALSNANCLWGNLAFLLL
jgi:hypothetical protein